MRRHKFRLLHFTAQMFEEYALATASVLGEAVVGLLYLAPISWSAAQPPDRVIPIVSAWRGLVGEIRLWQHKEGSPLPNADERLLRTFAACPARLSPAL